MPFPEHPLAPPAARWAAFADGLGLSERPLRERLAGEYTMTLMPVIEATLNNLPEPVKVRLEEVKARLTAHDGPNGRVQASINAMDDEEVRWVANELLEIGHVVGAYAPRVYEN
jgi:hypothetical protein